MGILLSSADNRLAGIPAGASALSGLAGISDGQIKEESFVSGAESHEHLGLRKSFSSRHTQLIQFISILKRSSETLERKNSMTQILSGLVRRQPNILLEHLTQS